MRPAARRATRRRTAPPPPVLRAPRVRPRPYDRREVLARWAGCVYCDGPAEVLDHLRPLARGGRDVETNVAGCCARCNHAKADMSLAEWAVTPNTEPK